MTPNKLAGGRGDSLEMVVDRQSGFPLRVTERLRVLPDDVPAGFEPAEVTVASEAQPTGSEAANPPSLDMVSVAYHRGFDRIVTTTRATGPYQLAAPDGAGAEAGWDDPLASGEGFFRRARALHGGDRGSDRRPRPSWSSPPVACPMSGPSTMVG